MPRGGGGGGAPRPAFTGRRTGKTMRTERSASGPSRGEIVTLLRDDRELAAAVDLLALGVAEVVQAGDEVLHRQQLAAPQLDGAP